MPVFLSKQGVRTHNFEKGRRLPGRAGRARNRKIFIINQASNGFAAPLACQHNLAGPGYRGLGILGRGKLSMRLTAKQSAFPDLVATDRRPSLPCTNGAQHPLSSLCLR